MSNVKKQAKVASKNNPNARGSKAKYFHKDKEIVPVKIHDFSAGKQYMAAKFFENKTLVLDSNLNPIRWNSIVKIRKSK